MADNIKIQQDYIATLEAERDELRFQLEEANDTIEAIRTGQVDALVVKDDNIHQLYTLRTADRTYRLFIEKMNEGAVTLNEAGVILYCNSRFAEMTGLPFNKLAGSYFKDVVAAATLKQYSELLLMLGDGDCKGEIEIQNPEKTVPVQVSFSTLQMEEGFAKSVIITDLTLQKENEKKLKENNAVLERTNLALEKSNSDLQQFASVASHDLQEPLRKIQVFAEIIKNKKELPAQKVEDYIDKIVQSGGRMRRLIDDILNYSRLSADNILFEPVNINEIIAEIKDDFELVLAEKAGEIVADPICIIEGNRGQLRQLFYNIISNAIKFSRRDTAPLVKISAVRISDKNNPESIDKQGKFCQIKIQDNGIGFNEKYLKNMFALFERLHAKSVYEGTGIGLALAKKITEKHNGVITASSTEGHGATFFITLPVKNGR